MSNDKLPPKDNVILFPLNKIVEKPGITKSPEDNEYIKRIQQKQTKEFVETAVDDTRAAGVETEITTPDEVDVSVTAGVEASTGYTLAGITDACETAIYDFLNALSAGEDVYLASLFEVVMGVTGVENVELALPAADTTIASDEIARPNVITIYPFGT